MAAGCPILILDESFAALDPETLHRVHQCVLEHTPGLSRSSPTPEWLGKCCSSISYGGGLTAQYQFVLSRLTQNGYNVTLL